MYELRVHYTELEMQNGELRRARSELEEVRDRYADLYDFAPVGYLTLDSKKRIIEANLVSAELFKMKKLLLRGQLFTRFVLREDWDILFSHFRRVLSERARQGCELRLAVGDGESIDVHLETTAVWNGANAPCWYRVVMMDISERRAMELALAQSEATLRRITDAIPVLISQVDKAEIYRFNNAAYEQWFGLKREAIQGHPVREILGDEAYALVQPYMQEALTGRPASFEAELPYRRGGTRFVQVDYVPDQNDRGQIQGFFALIQDLTERRRAEQTLREREAEFRALFTVSGAGATEAEIPGGHFIRVNPKYCEITGYSEAELLEMGYADLTHPDDQEADRERVEAVFRGEQDHWEVEKRYVRKDGTIVWVWVTGALIRDLQGRPWRTAAVIQDITARKRFEALFLEERQCLRHLAHHDPLTGLPNRILFQDRLQQAMAKAQRADDLVALLFLDLDRFKAINDTLGHTVGDRMLEAVAQRLKDCVRQQDTVARLGGDEFTILMEGLKQSEVAAKVATKVLGELAHPLWLDGHTLHVGASVGISLYPDNGKDIETLIKHADAAMYLAKEHGRGNYQFFHEALNTRAHRQLAVENALRQALEWGKLSIDYQPQISFASRHIVAVEALTRWHSTELGIVPTSELIQVAEDSGLIIALGKWVLAQACAQAYRWQKAGYAELRVAVNLSARQFRQPDLVEQVEEVLRCTGLHPQHLELELTESVLLVGTEEAIGVMERLKALGVHLSLDDFGTGYSSLAYLKRFPLDRLKVAQEFVRDIPANSYDTAIAKAIVTLARSLELEVVVEGVESTEQCELFCALGCDYVQGYLFSHPLSPQELQTLLADKESVTAILGLVRDKFESGM